MGLSCEDERRRIESEEKGGFLLQLRSLLTCTLIKEPTGSSKNVNKYAHDYTCRVHVVEVLLPTYVHAHYGTEIELIPDGSGKHVNKYAHDYTCRVHVEVLLPTYVHAHYGTEIELIPDRVRQTRQQICT